MSNKAILIAVLLALGLVGLIGYMNWRSGPGPSPEVVQRELAALPINAADVVGVKVKVGQIEDAVSKDAASSGGWVFVRGTGADAAQWPVEPAPVQNLIRAIAEVKPAAAADRSAKMPESAVQVTLSMKDGSTRFMRISPQAVGGKTLIDIDAKTPFMGDASLLAMATQPGPRGWRLTKALPGASATELSRVSLATKDETLAFSRQEGRWFLSRPISARTSTQSLTNLMDALGRVTIEKFVEDGPRPDASITGLNSPRLIITAERDVRNVDDKGQVRSEIKRRDLFIGGPADAAGTQLFAASDAQGTQLFMVNASSVAAISTAARSYLDLTASGASPADVGLITVKAGKQETGFRRQNGKWYKLLAGGKTDKTEVDSKAMAEMVEFFTQRPGQPDPVGPAATTAPAPTAPGTKPAAAPAPEEPIRTVSKVTLMTDDGGTLDVVTMGYTPEGTLAARAADVVIAYPGQKAPKLLGVPEFKSLPAQSGGKKKPKQPVGSPKK